MNGLEAYFAEAVERDSRRAFAGAVVAIEPVYRHVESLIDRTICFSALVVKSEDQTPGGT